MSDPANIIRPSILETVDSLLWLENVGSTELAHLTHSRQRDDEAIHPERCIICTLPLGMCEHTPDWIAERDENRHVRDYQYELDKEIDDVMDVLQFTPLDITTSAAPCNDIDLEHMQWRVIDDQPTDKIGALNVKLFVPDRRAWHTATSIEEKAVLIFGGMRSKAELPQPFSAVGEEDMTILGDLRVYDVPRRCWVGSKASPSPPPRFGHCASSLLHRRMLVMFGRGEKNRLFRDVWVYSLDSDQWVEVVIPEAVPLPAPRFYGECVQVSFGATRESVYVFGGTDGVANFDDLWILQVTHHPQSLSSSEGQQEHAIDATWVRGAAVGVAPSARYGHRMTYCHDLSMIVVSGGCDRSPQDELVGHTNSVDTDIELMHLANILEEKYRQENDLAVVAGVSLQERAMGMPTTAEALSQDRGRELTDLIKDAADVSAQLHLREKDTRLAEKTLIDAYKRSQAMIYYNSHRQGAPTQLGNKGASSSSIRNDKLGTYCLKLQASEDLIWQEFCFPRVQGDIPDARAFHAAACIGHFYFVMGGAEPTSLVLRHVDRPRQNAGRVPHGDYISMEVYVLDLTTRAWRHHQPTNSLSLHQDLLKLAELDVIRARRQVEQEAMTAKTLGLPSGQRTREQGLAEALLNVCIWRRDTLVSSIRKAQEGGDEESAKSAQNRFVELPSILQNTSILDERLVQESSEVISPFARLGCTLSSIRQRLFLVGGFPAPSQPSAPSKGIAHISGIDYMNNRGAWAFKHRTMVLDVEQDIERRRRQEEEHYAQLEEERRRIEASENIQQLLTAHEIREVIVRERKAREQELILMAKMDFLSSLPPLSRPGPVRMEKVNRHTLWLQWDRIYRDTRNKLVSEDDVVYFLYLRVGFENLSLDCPVAVLPSELESNVPRSTTLGLGLGLGLHLFAPPAKTKPRSRKNKRRNSMGNAANMLNLFMTFDDEHTRFRGKISKAWGDGTFDVKYDDGAYEAHVPRHRIRKVPTVTEGPSIADDMHSASSIVSAVSDYEADDGTHSVGGATSTVGSVTGTTASLGTRSRKMQQLQEQREKRKQALVQRFRQPILSSHSGAKTEEPPVVQRRNSSHLFHYQPKPHTYYRLLIPENGEGGGAIESASSPLSASSSHFPPGEPEQRSVCSLGMSIVSEHKPTVSATSEWRLVYVGTNNSYACTNLVPDHILLQERQLKVPIIASIQTLGLDYPKYERSQLSAPQAFFTLSEDEVAATIAADDDTRTVDSRSVASDSTAVTASTAMSRTKREIISAVLADQQICRIERLAQSCCSEGLGEEYL